MNLWARGVQTSAGVLTLAGLLWWQLPRVIEPLLTPVLAEQAQMEAQRSARWAQRVWGATEGTLRGLGAEFVGADPKAALPLHAEAVHARMGPDAVLGVLQGKEWVARLGAEESDPLWADIQAGRAGAMGDVRLYTEGAKARLVHQVPSPQGTTLALALPVDGGAALRWAARGEVDVPQDGALILVASEGAPLPAARVDAGRVGPSATEKEAAAAGLAVARFPLPGAELAAFARWPRTILTAVTERLRLLIAGLGALVLGLVWIGEWTHRGRASRAAMPEVPARPEPVASSSPSADVPASSPPAVAPGKPPAPDVSADAFAPAPVTGPSRSTEPMSPLFRPMASGESGAPVPQPTQPYLRSATEQEAFAQPVVVKPPAPAAEPFESDDVATTVGAPPAQSPFDEIAAVGLASRPPALAEGDEDLPAPVDRALGYAVAPPRTSGASTPAGRTESERARLENSHPPAIDDDAEPTRPGADRAPATPEPQVLAGGTGDVSLRPAATAGAAGPGAHAGVAPPAAGAPSAPPAGRVPLPSSRDLPIGLPGATADLGSASAVPLPGTSDLAGAGAAPPSAAKPPASEIGPFDDAHYRAVFDEFVGTKQSLGEPTGNLTFEGFRAKLKASEKQLVARHRCRAVRFQVLVKNRQVSLRPQLVR